MDVVVRVVVDIVDVLVVTKFVVAGVVLVLVVGGVDVTAVVGVTLLAWIAESVVGEARRVDVGIVVDPPPASGSSIWKLTSDVGVGDVAVLVVAVVDERVVNGIVVGVAVVLVVDVVVACSGSSWTSASPPVASSSFESRWDGQSHLDFTMGSFKSNVSRPLYG